MIDYAKFNAQVGRFSGLTDQQFKRELRRYKRELAALAQHKRNRQRKAKAKLKPTCS